jgi:ATP-binding cassette, subfamily C (CFTR/MRP), member 1
MYSQPLLVYYDRILVMDAGQVAELDSPLNLFDKEDSIFRSLCNEAGISRADIVRIRSGDDDELTISEPT